jgi:hypothetical protein
MNKPNLISRIAGFLTPNDGSRKKAVSLAVKSIDDNVFFGNNASNLYRDRYDYNREKVLAETLRAWRVNPIARSIVRTITAFVVGKGVAVASDHQGTDRFLKEWWDHPLNRIGHQLRRWKDEDTRAGNLFFLFSVDENTGMSYVRAVSPDLIDEIQTKENDVEQPAYFLRKELGAAPWPAYDPDADQNEFMLHYATNQPVGVPWGEPDLAPMLPWIGRLSSLLEDRARLNRFRNVFLYVVRGTFDSVADREKRQAELNSRPPQPGSILVTDDAEEWSVMSPELDSFDANMDILAIKKFICSGVNFPLHWLAEPESSTRTTAEAAGTPTFRNLEAIQTDFFWMLEDMARVAVQVRRRVDRRVKADAEISVLGPDITERDNSLLALAVNRIYPTMVDLYDRGMIGEDELIRLVYRMAGEGMPEGEPSPPTPLPGRGEGGMRPRAEADPGEKEDM